MQTPKVHLSHFSYLSHPSVAKQSARLPPLRVPWSKVYVPSVDINGSSCAKIMRHCCFISQEHWHVVVRKEQGTKWKPGRSKRNSEITLPNLASFKWWRRDTCRPGASMKCNVCLLYVLSEYVGSAEKYANRIGSGQCLLPELLESWSRSRSLLSSLSVLFVLFELSTLFDFECFFQSERER
jgi:hypothetical protein